MKKTAEIKTFKQLQVHTAYVKSHHRTTPLPLCMVTITATVTYIIKITA